MNKFVKMSNLQKTIMKARLPPMAPRSAKNTGGRQKDYSPTEWKEYFNDFVDVKIDEESSFRCYRSQPAEVEDSPVLVLLHGGGYNALSWAVFTVSTFIHESFEGPLKFQLPERNNSGRSLSMFSN